MKLLFWLILLAAFAMGIYACLPGDPPQTRLMSVYELQAELVSRGHDIKIDGKFGPNTDHALEIEVTKP
jgi:hypothetical protein